MNQSIISVLISFFFFVKPLFAKSSWSVCELEKPYDFAIQEPFLFPKICTTAYLELSAISGLNKPSAYAARYGKLYGAVYGHQSALHIQTKALGVCDLGLKKDELNYQVDLFSFQYGHYYLSPYRLSLGKQKPAFSLQEGFKDTLFPFLESYDFWPEPMYGLSFSYLVDTFFTLEAGFHKKNLEISPSSKDTLTLRLIKESSALGGSKLLFSILSEKESKMSYGFSFLNIPLKKQQFYFETIRSYSNKRLNKSLDFEQLIRAAYEIKEKNNLSRFVLDDVRLKFISASYEYIALLKNDISLGASLIYQRQKQPSRVKWYIGASCIYTI